MKLFAIGREDGVIELFDGPFSNGPDAFTMANHHVLKGHLDCVTSLCFSSDDRTLASGSWDTTVRLWHTASRQELGVLNCASRQSRSRCLFPRWQRAGNRRPAGRRSWRSATVACQPSTVLTARLAISAEVNRRARRLHAAGLGRKLWLQSSTHAWPEARYLRYLGVETVQRGILAGHQLRGWCQNGTLEVPKTPLRSDAGLLNPGCAGQKTEWTGAGSNRRHQDFQSCALPTELPVQ